MEKDVPKGVILVVTLFLTLSPWILVKFNFFMPTTTYSGLIIDILDQVPVDLIEVSMEGKRTYTDKTGTFVLDLPGNRSGQLAILPTSEFEAFVGEPDCQRRAAGIGKQSFVCRALIYPKPYSVASRVLALAVADPYKAIDQIKLKKERLWGYLSQNSRNLWENQTQFVDLLTTDEIIRTLLKQQPTRFTVVREAKILDSFDYFGYDFTGRPVAEVEAELVDGLGRKTQVQLRFIQEEGIWRYLIPESPTVVRGFNLRNKGVLRGL